MLDMKKKPRAKAKPEQGPNPWPDRLRALPDKTGKSHQELADSIGVARRTWRAWAYGESRPSKMAIKLLQINYGEFLK
jgi:DNA-binding transcriptional regulator YiaG